MTPQSRVSWPTPIHQRLLQNKVKAVFHGHDHLYARQDLDGIVYPEVSQPGFPGAHKLPTSAAEYGRKSATLRTGSGRLSVSASPDKARTEYVRTTLVTAADTLERVKGIESVTGFQHRA